MNATRSHLDHCQSPQLLSLIPLSPWSRSIPNTKVIILLKIGQWFSFQLKRKLKCLTSSTKSSMYFWPLSFLCLLFTLLYLKRLIKNVNFNPSGLLLHLFLRRKHLIQLSYFINKNTQDRERKSRRKSVAKPGPVLLMASLMLFPLECAGWSLLFACFLRVSSCEPQRPSPW